MGKLLRADEMKWNARSRAYDCAHQMNELLTFPYVTRRKRAYIHVYAIHSFSNLNSRFNEKPRGIRLAAHSAHQIKRIPSITWLYGIETSQGWSEPPCINLLTRQNVSACSQHVSFAFSCPLSAFPYFSKSGGIIPFWDVIVMKRNITQGSVGEA